MFGVILMAGYTANAQKTEPGKNIRGIIPIKTPLKGNGTAGHGIDGDAFAHKTAGYENVGDLFDAEHPTKTGHGLLHPFIPEVFYRPTLPGESPKPQIPVTIQLADGVEKTDKTIFATDAKINMNPNDYLWKAGAPPSKNEIQNCGVHFEYGDSSILGGDPNGPSTGRFLGVDTDLWCLFAGDRQFNDGSSYLDFEFLQASLTMEGAIEGDPNLVTGVRPITGGSGKFASEGPHGGRTMGDLLVTIEFTIGGEFANIIINKWSFIKNDSKGKPIYEYVLQDNEDPLLKNAIFCTNNTELTHVPFNAFDRFDPVAQLYYYEENQWAEGAINLTKLFDLNNKPCFVLSTVFIRTRTSGSSGSSQLKDFPGKPIQLNLDLRKLKIVCATDPKLPECSTSAAIEAAYNTWVAGFTNSGGAAPVGTNIGDIPKLTDLPACGGQLSFTYEVTDLCHEDPLTCTSTFTLDKDLTKPVITPPTDYSLTGCNTDWPTTVSATWTDNCGIGGLKLGNVAGVAGAVQTSTDG
ncbi:hypothetical protein E0I26_16325, partial [Flavobacterium rhamnosiphilum]